MYKYELKRIIGDGTYGIVYEGLNKETKEKVAIKKLKQKYKSLEECKNKIEIKVLEKLNHENIIQLKEVIREYNGEVSYIFEYCDCNLLEFIDNHKENNKKIPEPIIREIILQLTRGLKYLHSKHYLHRDLKPENILLVLNKYDIKNQSKNNINNSNIKVKIADFGTVKKIPTRDELTITEYVCTRWYRAPECVLRSDYYNESSDIWAIGCIMAELYKLDSIFPGENEFDQINQIFKILGTPSKDKWPWGYSQADSLGIKFSVYYKKNLKTILGYINNDGVNLLNDIFQFDPFKRPSCCRLLNHPYFKMIPRPMMNIPSGIRNSIPVKKLRESDYINYARNNTSEYKNRNNNIINNSEIFYNKRNSNQTRTNIDNNIPNKIIKLKNSDININKIYRHNNSSECNLRKERNDKKIFNYFKMINSSNIQNNAHNIKYITINETKNGFETKKVMKYNKNIEERKVNDANSPKKEKIRMSFIKQGKSNINYIFIKNNEKRMSLIRNSIEPKNNIDNKTISRLNSNYLSLNESKAVKKYNKDNIKKIKHLNIINYMKTNNINKYRIYPNRINNSNISAKDNNKEKENNIESKTKMNFINIANKRNKQRKNYKFYEIHDNNKSNDKYNNINTTINNNQKESNQKRCICSFGRNKINDKKLLQYNNNFITYIPTNILNQTQKNLSYIKTKEYSINNNIQLSPIKKNNIILFGRPTSVNKRKIEDDYNSNKTNRRINGKKLINIIISEKMKN